MSNYFFIGIGGSGMSAIAQMLLHDGHAVAGSDRSLDRGQNAATFDRLRAAGARLFPQDGSGVTENTDFVVVSTAIEDTVPDMAAARAQHIPVLHRAELLGRLFNEKRGIAVGGTSGKSTVTGMIAASLVSAGLDPSVINGGRINNFATDAQLGNTRFGGSDILVIESDESDGSIVNYKPSVSIITNITKDHKPVPELRALFETFLNNTRELCVLNADCPEAFKLGRGRDHVATFSLKGAGSINAKNVKLMPFETTFDVEGLPFHLRVPGAHNVANALAALAVCRHFNIEDKKASNALAEFRGIARRFDVIGSAGGVTVIDDFGHNPDKIRATLRALDASDARRLILFQAHGFAPTFFMKDELIEVFSHEMRNDDILFVPEIYYAGGTAKRLVSMAEIAEAVRDAGRSVVYREQRDELIPDIVSRAQPGDMVTVMGARDDTLTDFCKNILCALEKKFEA